MSVCFPIYFQAEEQRVKKLIVMRGTNKYDWAFSRDMKGAARSYFSKEDLGYYPPEQHGGIVGERLFKLIS
jgi:hypothetical protein